MGMIKMNEKHYLLWNKIEELLNTDFDSVVESCRNDIYFIKKRAYNELVDEGKIIDNVKRPINFCFACFVCHNNCAQCPIVDNAGICYSHDSLYGRLTDLLESDNPDKDEVVNTCHELKFAWCTDTMK